MLEVRPGVDRPFRVGLLSQPPSVIGRVVDLLWEERMYSHGSKGVAVLTLTAALSGCAHIDFGGEGLTYYDPKPYLFVTTTKDCVTTAAVLSVPEQKKVMKFKSGYGSSELSATLSSGMIASVGQKSDAKVPETLASVAALATAVPGLKALNKGGQVTCTPTATLYPIEGGVPSLAKPLTFPVK